jgi:hypothetical protein
VATICGNSPAFRVFSGVKKQTPQLQAEDGAFILVFSSVTRLSIEMDPWALRRRVTPGLLLSEKYFDFGCFIKKNYATFYFDQ